ncbi:unnamed protein product [Nyctereutes procyonoides]|uniref:(raccoon dog) hypothetical protein n=1 Tax=Nyctereutes procyonoides TaxID=34880 RepID=A0A811YIC1_NYCPR|nr:unnamed protein product [Nyctereutes procyonoides]
MCLSFPSCKMGLTTVVCLRGLPDVDQQKLGDAGPEAPLSNHTVKPRMGDAEERPSCLTQPSAHCKIWKKQKMMNDNLVTLMKQHISAQNTGSPLKSVTHGAAFSLRNQVARWEDSQRPSPCLWRTKLKGEMRELCGAQRELEQGSVWAASAPPWVRGLLYPSALCSPPPHNKSGQCFIFPPPPSFFIEISFIYS